MKKDRFGRVLEFLNRLKAAQVHFSLSYYRDDAISVQVVVPGERWEIDFLEDGSVDVERFVSSGEIGDETELEELFVKSDEDEATPEKPVKHNATTARK